MSTPSNSPAVGFRQALVEWAQSEGMSWAFAFKTLLTIFIALWISYRLELPQPTTVLATVIIVIQPQSGQVLAKSFYRIIGTLMGLTVTICMIALFPQERVLFLLALSCWIGVCTAGAARYRDFRSYAWLLSGYTAAMIGLPASLHPENAFMLAVWRVLEISLGILCSALVSALILPQSSSVPMRRMMHTRFRDFARFACDALAGNLDLERMEQVNARFAAEAVGFDTLRNASAFEDPHIRMRSGRLARLNHEFMVLSTRFNALHQLMLRLQQSSEDGRDVLEVLEPCRAVLGSVLEPLRERLYSDADAEQLAVRLEEVKLELMQSIRDARTRLLLRKPADDRLLDFNTAAELLYRFAGDLHSYALTQASLLQHRHEREQWQENFTPRAINMVILVRGMRTSLLVLALSTFWLATAWTNGPTLVMMAAIVSALVSTAPSPQRLARQLWVGSMGAAIAGCGLQLWVMPLLDGLPLLMCAIAPVFIVGAWIQSKPAIAGYGIGLMLWFCIGAIPLNQPVYDPNKLFNEYLTTIVAIGLAALAASVILPPNRPWLWRRLEHDLRMRVVFAVTGKLKGLAAGFESGTRDLISQAHSLASQRPDVQRGLLRWMFVVQEVGHAVIELRLEQAAMPPEPGYAETMPWQHGVRAMGRALVRLFIEPNEHNRLRALAAVEHAIVVVRKTPESCPPHFETSPLRRVLSYLHFIRSALLDRNSPLAETSPAVVGSLPNAA